MTHLARWRIYGSTELPLRPSIEERFWPKVDASGDCWVWVAYRDPNGYGSFYRDGGPTYAHRVAWELLVGSIPEGLVIDHLCKNPPCVNPDHLEPVPQRVNVLRGALARR